MALCDRSMGSQFISLLDVAREQDLFEAALPSPTQNTEQKHVIPLSNHQAYKVGQPAPARPANG